MRNIYKFRKEKKTSPIELKDPYIVVGGDLNGRNFDEAIGDYLDINLLNSGPTRGRVCLDKMAMNFNEEGINVKVKPPLESEDGTQSDHSVVVATASLRHIHQFSWKKIKQDL